MSEQIRVLYHGRDIIYNTDNDQWECPSINFESQSLKDVKLFVDLGEHGDQFDPPVPIYFRDSDTAYQGGLALSRDNQGVWVERCDDSQVRYPYEDVFVQTENNCDLINRIDEKSKLITATATRRMQLIEELEQFDPEVQS